MKWLIIVLSTIILGSSNLLSQDIETILAGVEKNNSTLIALRKSADAERIGNKTGLYLENPEFAFNYLWGSPESIGNRKDISLIQSFDFPSAYVYRNQISEYRNSQVELEYERQLISIMTQARLLCNELIYHNALTNELKQRIVNAQKIADSYRSKFEAGSENSRFIQIEV